MAIVGEFTEKQESKGMGYEQDEGVGEMLVSGAHEEGVGWGGQGGEGTPGLSSL